MMCADAKDRMLDDKGKDPEVAAHIENCRDCRSFRDTWEETRGVLAGLDGPDLPPDFARRVAQMAVREQGGVKKGIARLGDLVLTLLLGREPATEGHPLHTSLFWGFVMAAVSASMTLSTLFFNQSMLRYIFQRHSMLIESRLADSLMWLPGISSRYYNNHDTSFLYMFFSVCGLLFFLFSLRALNIRGLLRSLRSGSRISPWAIVLPVAGIFAAMVLWNMLLNGEDAMRDSLFSPFCPYRGIPDYFCHNALSPAYTLRLWLNPFNNPVMGWTLCALAAGMLYWRAVKGIPSLVLSFYGVLGVAVLVPLLTRVKLFSFLNELWSFGTLGIIDPRSFGLYFIALMVFAGFMTGMVSGIFRYREEGNDDPAFFRGVLSVAAFMVGISIIFFLLALPMTQKINALRHDAKTAAALLPRPSSSPVTHTLLVMKKAEHSRFLPEGRRYMLIPPCFMDNGQSGRMEAAAKGPRSMSAFMARRYLMAQAYFMWDGPRFFDMLLSSAEMKSNDPYRMIMKRDFHIGLPEKINREILARVFDDRCFYQSDGMKIYCAGVYDMLGMEKNARECLKSIADKGNVRAVKHSFITGGLVEGLLKVNGKRAPGIQIRLLSGGNLGSSWKNSDNKGHEEEEFLFELSGAATLGLGDFGLNDFPRSYDRISLQKCLPLIATRTDHRGHFRFESLVDGDYYMVVRFPEKLEHVISRTPVGVITLTGDSMAKDLGTLEIETEGRNAQ